MAAVAELGSLGHTMELPRRYTYNPGWRLILGSILLFGGGSPFMVYMAHHTEEGLSIFRVLLGADGAALFYWGLAVSCAAIAVMVVIMAVQQLSNPQFLELREDILVLPKRRFFQTRIIQIAYADIERVWEAESYGRTYLWLAGGGRKLTIDPSQLPDKDSYVAVRDFLQSHTHYQERQQPARL